MAEIGIMKKLTIGGSTYTIPEYNLPIASASTLGGVKIGTGLSINSTTGVLSATGLDYDEVDPVFTASAAYGITSSDISNWNGKTNTNISYDSSSRTLKKTVNGITSDVVDFGTAAFKLYTTTVTSDGTGLPTSAAVASFVEGKGYITGYTETDPVFSASAAANITSTDISNWNAKVSDDKTWGGVTFGKGATYNGVDQYIPFLDSTTDTNSGLLVLTTTPAYGRIPKYDTNGYLISVTPTATDNSTKVATTAFVKSAIPDTSNFLEKDYTGTSQYASIGYSEDNGTVYAGILAIDNNSVNQAQIGITPSQVYMFGPQITMRYVYSGIDYTQISIGTTVSIHNLVTPTANTDAATKKYVDDAVGGITDTNTTYTLTNALSSHKFTWTFTAGGSGSGSTTTTAELVAGTGITLTDDTTNKKITIASSVTVPTITLNGSSTTSPSFYAPTGAGTSGQYLKSSGSGAPTWTDFPTIPSITLNGSSLTSPSFYAPTSAGTNGYVLKSNGSGAPTWASAVLTDEKLALAEVDSNATYYPVVGTGTSAVTRQYDTTGFKYQAYSGTTTADGFAQITLGNSTASGTTGNKEGVIKIYGSGNGCAYIYATPNSYAHDWKFYLPLGEGATTTKFNLVAANSYGASQGTAIRPVYISQGGLVSLCSTYAGGTAVTLNGTSKSASTASFYAPTSAGSNGNYLKSNGSGEPSWEAFPTIPAAKSLTFAMDTTDTKKLKITYA